MSFAEDVKNELCHYENESPLCDKVETSALLRVRGSITIGQNFTVGMTMSTANNAVARRVLNSLKNSFSLPTSVMVRRGLNLRKKTMFTIAVAPSIKGRNVMEELKLWPPIEMIPSQWLKNLEVRRAFLRGAFLGGGSVNKPQAYYHLEFMTSNYAFAKQISQNLKYFNISAKITERKDDYIVYVKDGDGVTSCLRIMGASRALLQFEEVRIVKEMRNQVNRQVNCETANLIKTVNAAVTQIDAIKLLQKAGVLEDLPPKLLETAEIRMAHPSASLKDLIPFFSKKISKSGINHRLKKIEAIAQTYANESS